MTAELVKLDESFAEDFWRLRKELFTELGEVAESEDLSALEDATWPILARIWSAGGCWKTGNWQQPVRSVFLAGFPMRRT